MVKSWVNLLLFLSPYFSKLGRKTVSPLCLYVWSACSGWPDRSVRLLRDRQPRVQCIREFECLTSTSWKRATSSISIDGLTLTLGHRRLRCKPTVTSLFPLATDRRGPKSAAQRVTGAKMGRHARRNGTCDQNHHANDMRQGGCVFRPWRQNLPYRSNRRASMEHSNDKLREYILYSNIV